MSDLRSKARAEVVDWDEYGQGYSATAELVVCICGEPYPFRGEPHYCPYDEPFDEPDDEGMDTEIADPFLRWLFSPDRWWRRLMSRRREA